jgi:hypothetical protein
MPVGGSEHPEERLGLEEGPAVIARLPGKAEYTMDRSNIGLAKGEASQEAS